MPDGFIAKGFKEGRQKGSTAINGEHPEGGAGFQGHIPVAQGTQSGKEDFHTPVAESAVQEGFDDLRCFHSFRSFRVEDKYTGNVRL